jgi:hypothetical protein
MEFRLLTFRLFRAFRNPPLIDLPVGKSSAIPAGIDLPVGKRKILGPSGRHRPSGRKILGSSSRHRPSGRNIIGPSGRHRPSGRITIGLFASVLDSATVGCFLLLHAIAVLAYRTWIGDWWHCLLALPKKN